MSHFHQPTSDTRELASLVEQRLTTLRNLHELCRRQHDAATNGDTARLFKLLAAKQQLVATLQGIEAKLDPYRTEAPEQRSWPSEQDRMACRQQLAESEQLWDAVMQLEKQSERRLMERRDRISEQLASAGQAVQAHTAYHAVPIPPTSQFDVQSG